MDWIPADLAQCIFAKSSPAIGDPSAVSWLTVVMYIVDATVAGLVWRTNPQRQRLFWLVLAVLLAALAVNKQLDLQSALTAAGRCLARAQGCYDDRRGVQIWFVVAIASTSLVATLWLAWVMRRDLGQIWPALAGMVFLLAFIVIRAAGFHKFDRFIGSEFLFFRMNWLFEMGGIAMIAANALWLLARHRVARDPADLRKR